jgi:ADP-heptose:LPS heptosyltransferase
MDYDRLRKIDRLGPGLARKGLQGVRRITDRLTDRLRRRGPEETPARRRELDLPSRPKRLLVVKLWGLGNLVLAGRALTSLRTAYPECRITLLTTPRCAQVYDKNLLYNETRVFDPESEGRLSSQLGTLCAELAEASFDLAVNLDGLSELARLLTLRSGAAATVGLQPAEAAGDPYTVSVPFLPGCHVEDLLYEAARAAGGAKVPPGLVRPSVRSQERGFCQEILGRAEVDPHDLLVGVGVNAGRFAPERAWPAEKWALLAQQIEAEPEFRTVFLGGPGEERRVDQVFKLMNQPGLNITGACSMRQSMAFLERLHLFVGNDGGLAHLAAALGVPTVVIYGPESPARVGRREDEKHAAVYHARDCSPCVSLLALEKKECACGGACVREIPVEEVHHVVRDLLDHLSDPEEPPWLRK